MNVENWDELRTAYQVARLGTVSAAAEVLGVHHATVIRHVDALEARLGVKLFQRHARGYTPTEAGQDLQRVASVTDDQLTQLVGRLKGRAEEISGEVTITTVQGLGELLVPALAGLQCSHPGLRVSYITDHRLFRMEYGEAHVAVRAGPKPQDPDNVVQFLADMDMRLVASDTYRDRFGMPDGFEDLKAHRFVATSGPGRPSFTRWLEEAVPEEAIVFRASEFSVIESAILGGAGMGFVRRQDMERMGGLTEVMPPLPEWESVLWLVTHVDLHRTPKVQAVVAALKDAANKWCANVER